MGQYWKAVNVTKMENVEPDGIKLMEHAYFDDESVNFVLSLLAKDWFGDEMAWVGDYYDEDPTLYNETEEKRGFSGVLEYSSGLIVNVTKLEYVDLAKYLEDHLKKYPNEYGVEHPLPLLLACSSNGDGGGDYTHWDESDYEFTGRWFGDRIQYHPNGADTNGLTEIFPMFSENMPYSAMTMEDFNGRKVAVASAILGIPVEELTVDAMAGLENQAAYYAVEDAYLPYLLVCKREDWVRKNVLPTIDKTLREHVNVETLSKNYVDQPAVTFCSSDGKYVKEVTVRGKLYYIFMS